MKTVPSEESIYDRLPINFRRNGGLSLGFLEGLLGSPHAFCPGLHLKSDRGVSH